MNDVIVVGAGLAGLRAASAYEARADCPGSRGTRSCGRACSLSHTEQWTDRRFRGANELGRVRRECIRLRGNARPRSLARTCLGGPSTGLTVHATGDGNSRLWAHTRFSLSKFGPALIQPVGRLFWSETETSHVWQNYMEGAVASGERAAEQVVKKPSVAV